MFKKTIFSLLFLFIISSCSTYSDDNLKQFDDEIKSYVKKNNLNLKKSETGLYYSIINKGEGDPILYNDIASFKYTGKLLNGEVFDKSPGVIELKVSALIGAWKEIMTLLKPGGKAILVTPPQLGYGDTQLEKIPANSCLYFEIEVVSVK